MAQLIQANGSSKSVRPLHGDVFTLADMQRECGSFHISMLPLAVGYTLVYCGYIPRNLVNLPENMGARFLASGVLGPDDHIYGDALLLNDEDTALLKERF